MIINDRGTIKWTSIMLPEHVQMLDKIFNEPEKKKKPVLDEQEVEEINMNLHQAIHQDLPVEIQYYNNHDYKTVQGKLKKIDTEYLYLNDDGYTKVPLKDIIDVNPA